VKAWLSFGAGLVAGASLVTVGVVADRTSVPRAAPPTQVAPPPAADEGTAPVVADNAPAQALTVADVRVPLRFSRCTLEFLRDELGAFTSRGRYLRPGEILRRGRIKVVVVEAWYCKPCKRVVRALAGQSLGRNVDLVVLGTGGEAPGNHLPAVNALADGTGWLFVEGFDAEALLEAVFGKGHYATPSVLVVGPDDVVEAGIQSSSEDEIARWLTRELTVKRGVVAGQDQPRGSLEPDRDAIEECTGKTIARSHPPVATAGGGKAATATSPSGRGAGDKPADDAAATADEPSATTGHASGAGATAAEPARPTVPGMAAASPLRDDDPAPPAPARPTAAPVRPSPRPPSKDAAKTPAKTTRKGKGKGR